MAANGMRERHSNDRPYRSPNELPSRLISWLVILLVFFAIVACSLKLEIALFNNSGDEITVTLGHRNVLVAPTQSGIFDYPGAAEAGQLHLSTAMCHYIYQAPQAELPHLRNGGSDGPLKLQVEKDFAIYILPPDAKDITSVAELSALQQDGFPLRPMSKACR